MLSPFPPEPVRRPLMFQTWVHLTFLHWSYPPALLRPFVPPGLALDTFDGRAWVGLVPFYIKGTRAPLLPAMPWLSSFPETNVRTYVLGPDGSPGVWFFSLDAARLLAVIGARLTYGLPYIWSRMSVVQRGNGVAYKGRRIGGNSSAGGNRLVIEIGEEMRPPDTTDVDIFLTARFRLYTTLFGRLAFAQVEHAPYPLARARVMELEQGLLCAAGLPEPDAAPLVHYSSRVDVKIGAPKLWASAGTGASVPGQ